MSTKIDVVFKLESIVVKDIVTVKSNLFSFSNFFFDNYVYICLGLVGVISFIVVGSVLVNNVSETGVFRALRVLDQSLGFAAEGTQEAVISVNRLTNDAISNISSMICIPNIQLPNIQSSVLEVNSLTTIENVNNINRNLILNNTDVNNIINVAPSTAIIEIADQKLEGQLESLRQTTLNVIESIDFTTLTLLP